MPLRFRPVETAAAPDLAVAIGFLREVFVISFGDDRRLTDQFGADAAGWLPWLHARGGEAALALQGEAPVGLVVTGPFVDAPAQDPALGYVYTYHLVAAVRGRGLGAALDDHAMAKLAARGFARARLSVAEVNAPARRFYARRGWTYAGPRPDQPGVVYLEKPTGA